MKQQDKELEIGGVSFGLMSGVITTLGMIVGINAATESKLAIVASIFATAVADSLSDALGMHLAEESRLDEANKPIWVISLYTFLAKFTVTLVFAIPFLFFSNNLALVFSVIFGLCLVFLLSIFAAKRSNNSVFESVIEHVSLAIIVIVASYYVGSLTERIVSNG